MAGHKLFVAGSATLDFLATAGTTATHAACHVLLIRANQFQDGILEMRENSRKTPTVKGRLNNVDDVFHF